MVRYSALVLAACVLGVAAGQALADPPAGAAGGGGGRGGPPPPLGSEAEQIAQLQRVIEADQQQLAQLQDALNDPRQEYAQAEAEFERVDSRLRQKQKAQQALQGEGKADRVRLLEVEIAALQPAWKLAKERFELAIEERKARRSEIATLQRKIEHDRQALARLTDASARISPPPAAEPPAASPTATAEAAVVEAMPPPSPAAAPVPAPAPAPAASSTPPPAVRPIAPGASASANVPAAAGGGPGDPPKPTNRELLKALQEEKAETAAVHDAEEKAQSITERIGDLDEDIALEQKLLETAHKKADNAHEAQAALAEQLRTRSVAGGPPQELQELAQKAREAEQRAGAARAEVRQHAQQLDELQSERAGLLAQQLAAHDKARAEERRLAEVQGRVRQLENPFAPRNVLHWLIDHGPKMLAIALAMLVLSWLARLSSRRIVTLIARGGFRGSKEEREARAHTLVGVFHNAASVLIVGGGILMLLQEAGIPIAPLLGGAAVFGLAVAFGAQNLIRDYFYGFVILLENQYKINDVVKIGSLSGSVERITLRMTVLRDLEGCVHFLPNGQISSVTNMTHGWSRAVFEVPVAYKEDIDRVMALLVEMGRELREDPTFAPMILEDLTMLGVDALGESAVMVKFFIKTRPLQQWAVKRELLRRIKNRFAQLGLEIPYPHRVLYHRLEEGAGDQAPAPSGPTPAPASLRAGPTTGPRSETRPRRGSGT